jgi:ubiquinone/menaquinone biosynthesis C-methylase UbiE
MNVEREIASRVAPQVERYSETLREWRETDERTKAILAAFGPQLGEIAFHSIVLDDRIERMSNDDAAAILEVAKLLPPQNRPLRILEIGVYAHFSVHRAATELGGRAIAVSHDISANALRIGKQLARERNFRAENIAVAGDFHDLPFNDNSFDIVFCNSCIHHTWRPWIVLQELLRVCRPGGIVRLQNEPVIRVACFYKFRGRRPEAFQGVEAEIKKRRLATTISSPFPGSRAEQLFGMIENDRISLDVFRRTLCKDAELLVFDPNPQCNIGEFENWLLALDRTDPNLEEKISSHLHQEIASVAQSFDERDALSGMSLPSSDDIWLLSYRIGERLRMMDGVTDSRPLLAELFGAALQATARKHGLAEVAPRIFRRDLTEDRGVFMDPPPIGGVTISFSNAIPEIEMKSDALARVFPEASWFVVEEANGFSITNHTDGGPLMLPATKDGGLLLLRVHSVPADVPYVFSIRVNDAEAYSFIVTHEEGHLARIYVEPHALVRVQLSTLEGQPIRLFMSIRIGVAAFLPVSWH